MCFDTVRKLCEFFRGIKFVASEISWQKFQFFMVYYFSLA